MKRYPTYKPSGVQWLGEVPDHWNIDRLKFLTEKIQSGGTPDTGDDKNWSTDESGIAWVSISDMSQTRVVERTEKRITEKALGEKNLPILPTGTLIYAMYASIGKVSILGIDAVVNQALLGIHTIKEKVTTDYLEYWLRFLEPIIIEEASSNTQLNLNAFKVKNFIVSRPTKSEQLAIVSYLDRKNAEIDGFVASKRKLIALLNEERAAFIQKVVLRGLNPDVPMKQTGVDWLGEVPAHWEVKRVKYLFREINERSEAGDGVRRLSMSQKYGLVDQSSMNERPDAEDDGGFKMVAVGDLVLNKLKSHLGVFATANLDGAVSPDYAVYRTTGLDNVRYFERLFKTRPYIAEFTKAASGIVIGFLRLYTGDFFNIPCVCPPVSEQNEIAAEIEKQSQRIDAAISRIEREIELINEYRTALISEVVTGKIDVREAVSAS